MAEVQNSEVLRYERERQFFDRRADMSRIEPVTKSVIERYALHRHAHLFAKELMFEKVGNPVGKRICEIGSGEGLASVQLALLGAHVTGIDISPQSIRAAQQRADVNNVSVAFKLGNIEKDELGCELYDVVWCDLILHHLVPSLDVVLQRVYRALKPGGRFIAREPVAYAKTLKWIRGFLPPKIEATPDEQPLRQSEMELIAKYFPGFESRYYRILARVDKVTNTLPLIAAAARLDNLLLWIPGARSLAGNVVIWADKPH